VALDLPDDALAAVRAWQELVFADLPDLRSNHALHVTLCFLGETPSRLVPQLSEALASVPFQRCWLAFGEPIFLPERGKKNVVALPLVDAAREPGGLAAVCELQADVGAALAAGGFSQRERRAYLPHVTVARFRRPGHPFPLHIVNLAELCPSRLVLYTSVLDKAGAAHTPLAEFTPR
jgi:2'-5' RNA ligase